MQHPYMHNLAQALNHHLGLLVNHKPWEVTSRLLQLAGGTITVNMILLQTFICPRFAG